MRRRTILAGLGALVATLAVLAGVRLYPSSSPDIGFALPDGDLVCSVKASCDVGEVDVLRMSGLTNAHAQTADSHAVTYGETVCCTGPAGLSTAPEGCYVTVLTLSNGDNAHAAEPGGYSTEVTLSAPETAIDCTYGTTCDSGYSCLATMSGSTNAHVADCNGVEDYATKVCCRAQPDVNSDSGPPPPASYTGSIGNGCSIAGDDATVANGDAVYDACDPDHDNDGILDAAPDPDPGGDITYDDDGDGETCFAPWFDSGDDGPSWDSDCNAVIDGMEGQPCGSTSTDTDGDGLMDAWETCKWGTDPNVWDSDGDSPNVPPTKPHLGDCVEAADVDGNGLVDYVGDVIYYAKAALLPAAAFGKDGGFDINGDGIIDFVGDVIYEAKFALGAEPCL